MKNQSRSILAGFAASVLLLASTPAYSILTAKGNAPAATLAPTLTGAGIHTSGPTASPTPWSNAGLVGYWAFDEGSGPTAYDGSGQGNRATLSGASWTTAHAPTQFYNPGALEFHGGAEQVAVDTAPVISARFTVAAWVQSADQSGQALGIIGSRQPDEYGFAAKFWQGALVHGEIGHGGGWLTTDADAPLSYNAGEWYHVAYVVTETTYTIYVNGLQAATNTWSIKTPPLLADANHRLFLGATGYAGEGWMGALDEVRIYARALSPSEVAGLVTLLPTATPLPTETVTPRPTLAGQTPQLHLPFVARDYITDTPIPTKTPFPTNTPSPTPSPTSTPSPTAPACTELIADGSFESGLPNSYWFQYSTHFDTPLCNNDICGDGEGIAGPRTGAIWAWLGGAAPGSEEIAGVAQDVAFPSGGAVTLTFWVWLGAPSDHADSLSVLVDDTPLFTIAADDPGYSIYQPVALTLDSYADGALHHVEFYATTGNGETSTTFNLDDVSVCHVP